MPPLFEPTPNSRRVSRRLFLSGCAERLLAKVERDKVRLRSLQVTRDGGALTPIEQRRLRALEVSRACDLAVIAELRREDLYPGVLEEVRSDLQMPAEWRTTPAPSRSPVQMRDGAAMSGQKITGLAAVFYDESDKQGTRLRLFDDVVEQIGPHAFDDAVASGADVMASFNHDFNQLLGRTSAGTLHLKIEKRGLRYVIDVPSTTVGRDVAELVRRGDVRGSSFMFRTLEERLWKEGSLWVRSLERVELIECGCVAMPAYSGTTAGIRGLCSLRAMA